MSSKFTKQHYEIIAAILSKHLFGNYGLITEFEEMFRNDNPNFSSEKFRKAVYGSEE